MGREIAERFKQSVSDELYTVIQNKYLWDRYCQATMIMIRLIGDGNINEKSLWRGDKKKILLDLLSKDLERRMIKVAIMLKEYYFLGTGPDQSIEISNGKMILCQALCGESHKVDKSRKLTD